ncbi:MAG: zinc ribbon domain-containing protein [Clostridiales bacterium]|nr:zinc ribbon domain-containing protein [Clostridiales bacterium]
MGIFRSLFRKIDEIFLSIIWLRKVKIEDTDLNKISDMLNQHFITGASAEDIAMLNKIAKCSFVTRISTGARIRTKDKKYTFRVIKYRLFLLFTFYRAAIYDDTIKDKRTMYYTYKGFSDYDLLNYIDSYLHPRGDRSLSTQPMQHENINVNSKCPGCGAEIAAGAKFCPECGAKIENTTAVNTPIVNTLGESIYDMSIYYCRKYILIGIAAVCIIFILGTIIFDSGDNKTNTDSSYDTDITDYDYDYEYDLDDDSDNNSNSNYDYGTDTTDEVCADLVINSVKNAVNSNYPNTTYGEAFDSFFAYPNWEYFIGSTEDSDEEHKIVEFTGNCTYQDVEVEALLQFTLYDNGTFKATYLSFNDVPQNELMIDTLIKTAFDNTLPEENSESGSTGSVGTEYYGSGYKITLPNDWVQENNYETSEYDLSFANYTNSGNITVWVSSIDNFSTAKYLNYLGVSGRETFLNDPMYEEIDGRYYTEYYMPTDNGYDTIYRLECAANANSYYYEFTFETTDSNAYYELRDSVKESFSSVSFY